jgi:DNA-binding NtrC family response regulator
MIYIFTHDRAFADKLIAALPEKQGEIFDDEARLAGSIARANGILFDLRSEPKPMKLLERIYYETPTIPIVAVYQSEEWAEPLFDRGFPWPVDASEIVQAFNEIKNDRSLLESCGLVGRSKELAAAARVVAQVAASDINVLITGPSGAG